MPINPVGEVQYQHASPTGGIRFQANPPVCNRCWREITPRNFGCASVVGEAPLPSRFEFIECTVSFRQARLTSHIESVKSAP